MFKSHCFFISANLAALILKEQKDAADGFVVESLILSACPRGDGLTPPERCTQQ